MRTLFLFGFTLIFCVSLLGCSSNDNDKEITKIEPTEQELSSRSNQDNEFKNKAIFKFTIKDITTSFEKAELHLKPQADDDYPRLNNVKPSKYELLDGSVFIYEYRDNGALKDGLDQVQNSFSEKARLKVHEINNVLILYVTSLEDHTAELADQINVKIQGVIQEITKQEGKQNDELIEQIKILKEEKEAFFSADQYGRELYRAMVHGNIEKLEQLTTSYLQVFDERFEVKVNEKTIEVPFSSLQTQPYLNNHVILKTNGYAFDQNNQVMKIHYMMIHPEKPSSYMNVELIKVDHLRWKSFYF